MVLPNNLDPILTRTAVVLAEVEATYNVDPTPSPATDAVQVEDPNFTTDLKVLSRNFLRFDLSPIADRIGRKLAGLQFGVELRGNGTQDSGALVDAPILARLMRGCGYALTSITGTGTIEDVVPDPANTKNPTWAKGGVSDELNRAEYKLTVVLGGASATAKVRVSGGEAVDDTVVLPSEELDAYVENDAVAATTTLTLVDTDPLALELTVGGVFQAGDVLNAVIGGVLFSHTIVSADTDLAGAALALKNVINAHALIVAAIDGSIDEQINITFAGAAAGVVVTSGSTAISLGGSGATLTPTWTGNLVLGEFYDVEVYPVGISANPISRNFESLTLYFYKGDVLHKITGALGTFTIDTTAGEFGKVNFTFTGQYHDPVDSTLPEDAVFDDTAPPMIEEAKLRIDGFDAVVEKFTFDQGNQVVPRPSVNDTDGYRGVRITGRTPVGGIDPEATLVADYNFWGKLSASTEMPFTMRVGSEAGNIVLINAPRVQYTNLTYQSREDLAVYDAGLKFARKDGNDEVRFHFC